jgi:molecular chaperone Hsp33
MPKTRDCLTRFLLERAHVRGALVRLDETWQAIRARTAYPEVVADYLGQCCAASALFTASLKLNGRLSIQLRGESMLRRVFAECQTDGILRGIAHFDEPVPESLPLTDFGAKAVLAITIENNSTSHREPQRYQGMVGLQAENLSMAFEDYFMQSEQLPTRIMLFTNGLQAAGVLIQQLPDSIASAEDWQRAQALFETLSAEELFGLDPDEILFRLFHEESVRVLETQPLAFGCSCSRARVESTLVSLGQAEIEQTIAETGDITVHCDFCGQGYHFTAEEGLSLFWPDSKAPPSKRLH